MAPASAFDLSTCARPNVLKLHPYRCARDDYKDDGQNVLLDANENAYGPGLSLDTLVGFGQLAAGEPQVDYLRLHRYPDPHQHELKEGFCRLRNTHTHTRQTLRPDHVFCGVGSDEAIDALLRCFCVPGRDKVLTCPPTYGMYAVSAEVNDVEIVAVPLDAEDGFALRPQAICDRLSADPAIKMVYICSPGNPTAGLIRKRDIQQVLEHATWNGVVVVDEAYIDFAPDGASLAEWVLEWPNLVVMQTLSKAFGLAGVRLGVAFSSPAIAALLNNMKAPYNISSPTSVIATAALQPASVAVMRDHRAQIVAQRDRLVRELPRVPGVGRLRGGTDANFVLVEILDRPREQGGRPDNATALAVYETMAGQRGVVVRFRGKEHGCHGCLRITVGTAQEVDRFLAELQSVLHHIFARGATEVVDRTAAVAEATREVDANAVVS